MHVDAGGEAHCISKALSLILMLSSVMLAMSKAQLYHEFGKFNARSNCFGGRLGA